MHDGGVGAGLRVWAEGLKSPPDVFPQERLRGDAPAERPGHPRQVQGGVGQRLSAGSAAAPPAPPHCKPRIPVPRVYVFKRKPKRRANLNRAKFTSGQLHLSGGGGGTKCQQPKVSGEVSMVTRKSPVFSGQLTYLHTPAPGRPPGQQLCSPSCLPELGPWLVLPLLSVPE